MSPKTLQSTLLKSLRMLLVGLLLLPQTLVSAQQFQYTITVDTITENGLEVTLEGSGSGTPYVGQLEDHDVEVIWGDGNVSPTSTVNFVDPNGAPKEFTGTWSNSHTYATAGVYDIVVKLYHAQSGGNDASDDATVELDDVVVGGGNLTVTKVVVNDGGGTLAVEDFPLYVNETSVTSGESNEFEPGDYVVSEDGDDNYEATFSGDCDESGNVVLETDDELTCTITNTFIGETEPETGSITIVKEVVNDNGGELIIEDFTLYVDTTEVTTGASNEFNVGSYVVSEDGDAGYAATFSGDCDESGNITLAADEDLTCTITNDDIAPTLTVVKQVINDNGGEMEVEDFTLYIDETEVTSGDSNEVAAGNHVVSEDEEKGYTGVISGDCDGDGNVTLALGEDKTCIIVNDDDSEDEETEGTVIIIKEVINDDGGTNVAEDFSLTLTGEEDFESTVAGSETGVIVKVPQGDYEVAEDDSLGYEVSYSDDCEGSVDAGEVVTCTVTNDDVPEPTETTITVIKEVINDNGGDKEVEDFPLYICVEIEEPVIITSEEATPEVGEDDPEYDCIQVTSGEVNVVDAGDFLIMEDGDEDYEATFSGDCDEEGNLTVEDGESATCTTSPTTTSTVEAEVEATMVEVQMEEVVADEHQPTIQENHKTHLNQK